jgi:predicted transposase YbfD/YdcC
MVTLSFVDFSRKDGFPMSSQLPTFIDCFADLPDPRNLEQCQHKLIDILFIAVCAVICGADGFTDMAEFGIAKQAWLKQFLELANGIPSHDTFNRLFARLRPKELQSRLLTWIQSVVTLNDGDLVAIDGKTLRRSHQRQLGKEALELVSAWVRKNRLMLAQLKVAEDSNEITAVPPLLRLLELKGCIVSLDAMHCQKATVAEIREQQADYVVALKSNQGQMYEAVKGFFEDVEEGRAHFFEIQEYQTVDGEHGRIEERRYCQVNVPEDLPGRQEWRDLTSLALCESKREVKGEVSVEKRYYLSSLSVDVQRMSEAIRGHWSIENSFHWILDVVFKEDDCRVRVGEGAENLAIVRRLALSLLQQEKSVKRGVKTKRLKAALDEAYLLKILNI